MASQDPRSSYVNLTFHINVVGAEDLVYFVSHGDVCASSHNCWEVTLDASGGGASHSRPITPPVSVEVAFLPFPGQKKYKVSQASSTTSSNRNDELRSGACDVFNYSVTEARVNNSDRSVYLSPMRVNLKHIPNPPTVNISAITAILISDVCPLNCSLDKHSSDCGGGDQNEDFLRRQLFRWFSPYEEKLHIGHIHDELRDRDKITATPLNYHCVRLIFRNCLPKALTIPVVAPTSSSTPHFKTPDEDSTGRVIGLVTSCLLLAMAAALVLIFSYIARRAKVRKRGKEKEALATGLAQLGPQQQHLDETNETCCLVKDKDGEVEVDAVEAAKDADSAKPEPKPTPRTRVLLLYWINSVDDPISKVAKRLKKVLEATGRVQVLSSGDSEVLEDVVPREFDYAVVLSTPEARESARALALVNTPACADAYQQSFRLEIKNLMQSFSEFHSVTRIVSIGDDVESFPNLKTGVLYRLPDRVVDLLQHIDGAYDDRCEVVKESCSALREIIQTYTKRC